MTPAFQYARALLSFFLEVRQIVKTESENMVNGKFTFRGAMANMAEKIQHSSEAYNLLNE